MGLGSFANKASLATARMMWNSGDSDKQNIALTTWTTLVSTTGDLEAIEMLQELANQGVKEASGALLIGLTAQAKKAAKKKDKDLAETLVTLHNNGWTEATNAIQVVLPKIRAAKGSEKHIEVVRLFADAGFPPAIAFFEGDEDALDFDVDDGGAKDASNQALSEVKDDGLPPWLQALKPVFEDDGYKCHGFENPQTHEVFLESCSKDPDNLEGPVFRIVIKGNCVNMEIIFLAEEYGDEADREASFVWNSMVVNSLNMNRSTGDPSAAIIRGKKSAAVIMRKETISGSFNPHDVLRSFKELEAQAIEARSFFTELSEAAMNAMEVNG